MRWWSVAWLVIACGPAVPTGDGGSTGGGETSTSTTVTSTTTGTNTTTSAGPTTVDPGTSVTTDSSGIESTSSSESGCEDSTGTPRPPLCGPEPDQDGLSFRIDDDVDGDELAVDGPCTVENVEVAEFSFAYTVACDDGEHVLVAEGDPPIDLGLAVGDDVHVRAFRNYPIDFGGYHFLAVRDVEGSLLAASYEPYQGYVPPEVDVAAYYAPITFEVVDVGCEPIPGEDASYCGGAFIVPDCPTDQTRLAVDFVHENDAVQIWDFTTADLGPFHVRAYARFYDPVEDDDCVLADRPYTGLRWAALRPI